MGKPKTSVVWPTVSQAVSHTQRNALIEATAVANGSNDSTHACFYPCGFLVGCGSEIAFDKMKLTASVMQGAVEMPDANPPKLGRQPAQAAVL